MRLRVGGVEAVGHQETGRAYEPGVATRRAASLLTVVPAVLNSVFLRIFLERQIACFVSTKKFWHPGSEVALVAPSIGLRCLLAGRQGNTLHLSVCLSRKIYGPEATCVV